jgi:hypothetical protein
MPLKGKMSPKPLDRQEVSERSSTDCTPWLRPCILALGATTMHERSGEFWAIHREYQVVCEIARPQTPLHVPCSVHCWDRKAIEIMTMTGRFERGSDG